jgi:L-asparaginase
VIILGSSTAESGLGATVTVLRGGGSALDAVEAGIRLVEVAPDVHCVGQDAWPNLLGQSELDASIMDGETLDVGAVGALRGFIHPISVARRVMEDLPHVLLVGEGAARFADEIGASRGDLMSKAVREGWVKWLRERTSAQEWRHWPGRELAPWSRLSADPETAHGTVCILVRDSVGNTAVGVSTSGWAWKYPGRLGDSPIAGAGNYADNRHGAAACTGFGEMAIRAGTARSVVLYLKMGLSVQEAVRAAADDLGAAEWRYRGVVTIYAFDRSENHQVMTHARGGEGTSYWIWRDGMHEPELRTGKTLGG